MSDSRESQILAAISMLEQWPSDGKPDRIVGLEKTVAFAEATEWIKRIQRTGPCKCCGMPRPGQTFFLITPAGRAALELHRIHTRSGSIA